MSIRAWVIGSVIVLVAPLIWLRALPEMTTGELLQITIAQWLAISVLALASNFTIFRRRRVEPVALGWVVGFAVVLGFSRVVVVFAVQRVQPGPPLTLPELLNVAIASVPATVVAYLLTVYLLAITDWYATERERLLRADLEAEAARLRAIGALDATRTVVTTRIRENLENQLAGLDAASASEHLELSDRVLDAAEYVRPESQALWSEQQSPSRRGSLRDLERASLAAPLPLLVPYALWIASAVPFTAIRAGLTHTLLAAAAVLAGMVIAYPVGRRAIRRFAPAPHFARARLLTLVTMLIASLPVLELSRHLNGGDAQTVSTQRALVSIGMIVAFTIIASWVQAGLRAQGERLRELRSHAEEADFQRLALQAATEQMQRDLALYLHSTVQAGLVASAYAMQDAAARGDDSALEQAIIEARIAAARVGEHAPAPAERELSAMRASIDETWQGLLEVDWTLPTGALEAQQLERVSNVVQECLANALIHGAASEATVRIRIEDDSAIVELTDNGRGVGDGKPGLGSAVFNEATGGQWTIASVPTGGAQVRAVVPV
ncbi:MAG: hypothetical protein WCN97_00865 [Thermoleophilia bacterium]